MLVVKDWSWGPKRLVNNTDKEGISTKEYDVRLENEKIKCKIDSEGFLRQVF
jgi:hypothetical protein